MQHQRDPLAVSLLDREFDRRRFLALLASVAAAGALAGCAGPVPTVTPSLLASLAPSPSGLSAAPTAAPNGTYETLRRLLAIVRQSPDHLGTLAAAAVAGKDPAAIVRFVQEHIAVLPATSGNADPVTDVRWGQRAALRAGAGTLRERADLVLDLLRHAGLDGRIVSIPSPASTSFPIAVPVTFAPDTAAIAAVWDAVNPAHSPVGTAADDIGTRADAMTERLLAALPAELRAARLMLPPQGTTIPAVEFTQGGVTKWALGLGGGDPVLTTAPSGLLGASDAVVPRVSVAVSVALNPPAGSTADRTVLHEVLRGDWAADEVAGRQFLLGFAVPGAAADALRHDRTTAPIRQPVLRLLAAEPLGKTKAVAAGTLLSTAGGLVTTSPTDPGKVIGPLGPLAAPAAGGKAGALVAALGGSVVAASFPEIEVRVQAHQADGSSAVGLTAGDFQVTEGGVAQAVTVIANTAPAGTRVLVIYDTSGSVTDFWGSAAKRTAFETTLVSTLVSAAKATPFLVQVIGVGDSAHEDKWAAPDPATLTAALAAVASNSDVWLTLGRSVPASGAAAALLISDNAALDVPADIPAFRRALRASGVPVACLPLGTVDQAATALILADTGGPRLDVKSPALASKLGAFVGEAVGAASETNYRLRYQAPDAGPASRAVRVAIAGSGAAPLQFSYNVPVPEDRAAPSGIAGIYLTIRVGDHETVRRLGGVRVSERGTPDDTANAMAIAEAMTALNALHTISFEPASTTTAHLLDDVISAALTAEAVEKAWSGGPDAIIAAGGGWRRFPATLAWLMDPVAAGSSLAAAAGPATAPDGLRVTVLSDQTGADGVTQRSDVVPILNRAIGRGTDAGAAFGAAMRATIGASLREADAFSLSAAGQIGSASLVAIPALATADTVVAWSPAQRAALAPMLTEYAAFHRLLPASGDIAAMWVIDPDTGSTTAVGADGRGSGTLLPPCLTPSDPNEATAFISVSIALIGAACLAIGTSEPSFGCVGADVFGAVSAGLAAFTAPPDVPGSAFGAFSYGVGLASGGIDSAAGRTIMAVLLLIAGLLVGGRC